VNEAEPKVELDQAALEAQRIAAAIAQGDRRAEDAFVRRFGPGLTAVLRVRCNDPELCKDLAQETLRVALLRLRAGKMEQPEAMAGFLRGTALNLLANELRRSERRMTESAADWIDEIVSESSDPYDTVESEDLVHHVREVIGGMKVARDRELLWCFYVDEEPKEVLCTRFELSSEHFDRVLHRARQRLKELWQARGAAPG
jgi:RNA polymerase sigma factor (sigma-70 family)